MAFPIDGATSPGAVQSMLETLRSLQGQASGGLDGIGGGNAPGLVSGPGGASGQTPAPGFLQAVRSAVEQVNGAQVQAQSMQAAYQRGDGVPLTDVVLGMHRASLAMEATVQVRNKVLKAYEDMLNMPM